MRVEVRTRVSSSGGGGGGGGGAGGSRRPQRVRNPALGMTFAPVLDLRRRVHEVSLDLGSCE